jgi:Zn-dependent protease
MEQLTAPPASSDHIENAQPETPQVDEERPRSLTKLISGIAVSIGLLLLKLKALLFLAVAKFKLLAVNPLEGMGVAQLVWAGGSMIVSLIAYAVKWRFAFAAGFLALIVIHEFGHAVAIRAKGLRAGAMVFIPFIGGAVTLKDQPRSAFDDAQIGIAGPIAGTLAALLARVIFHFTGSSLYLVLAYAGFLLNLFNLLPIAPLDGGRIAGAISKWTWIAGGVIVTFLMIKHNNPFLIFILLLGIYQLYRSVTHDETGKFYDVTPSERRIIALMYFALVSFLGYETALLHRILTRL